MNRPDPKPVRRVKAAPSPELIRYAAKRLKVPATADEVLHAAAVVMGLSAPNRWPHNYDRLLLQACHDAPE